jgi:hypothetical protein
MNVPWWKRLPARLIEEDRALHSLRVGETPIVREHRWFRDADGEPRLRVELGLSGDVHELEVCFPAHYPDGCPSVRPIPYEKPVSDHQFRSGVLCLELGPDNWHSAYTAADMVRSAWRLVASEIIRTVKPFPIPSRHMPDLAERAREAAGMLVRSAAFEAAVQSAQTHATFDYVLLPGSPLRVFPVALPSEAPLDGVAPALRRETRRRGRLVCIRDGTPTPALTTPEELTAFVGEHSDVALDDETIVLILRWPSAEVRGFVRAADALLELTDMPIDAVPEQRVPEAIAATLGSMKVGIVGLGSLGSKVAVSLARTGVRHFLLVDGDVTEPHNICRHEATFGDMGTMKVAMVKARIRDVSPTEPEVAIHAVNLGSATNPEYHGQILAELASADVLIDATANPEAFCLLAMVASDGRRPLVWGEVFGGGIGGLVGSAHPDHDPCPRCVRSGFLAAVHAWPPAPHGRTVEAYGGTEETPLPAADAHVSFVAAAVTSRVLDLLTPPVLLVPSVTLLGLRRGWIFESPIQTEHVRVRRDDWSCARCWTPPALPDPKAAATAAELLALHEHADNSRTT